MKPLRHVTNPLAQSLARQFWAFLVVVALFGVGTLGAFAYRSERHALQEQVTEKLSTVAAFKIQELTTWIEERQADVRMLAQNRLNQEHFTEIFDSAIPIERKTEFALFLRDNLFSLQRARTGYTEISFVDLTGTVVISTLPDAVGRRETHIEAFQQALSSPDGQGVQDMHRREGTDEVKMAFAHVMKGIDPETRTERSDPIGVIVTVVNMDDTIYPLLGHLEGLGSSAETFLVRAEGDTTVYLSPLLFDTTPPLERQLSTSGPQAEAAHRAARGEHGALQGVDYRGKPVLAVYDHVDNTGWGFVAKQDLDEAFAPVQQLAYRFLSVAVIVLLLASLLAVILARALTRPITELVTAARSVAQGDLSVEIRSVRKDEIGVLSASFSTMVNALVRRQHQVRVITEMLEEMNGTPDILEAFQAVVTSLRATVTCDSMSLAVLRPEADCFEIVAIDRPLNLYRPGAMICSLNSTVTSDICAGRVHLTPDLAAENQLPMDRELYDAGYRSRISLPLEVENRIIGMLSIGWLWPSGYKEDDLPFLAQFAKALALALERSRLFVETRQRADDLEQAYAELRRSDQLKDDFIRNITHELRTPVATLSGYSELLLDDDTSNLRPDQMEMLEIVAGQTDRISRLVNDIIALHQVWQGYGRREMVRLEEVAQARLAEATSHATPAHNLTLNCPDLDVYAPVDPDQLERVLDNLLDNAVKFSPNGGNIVLSIQAAPCEGNGAGPPPGDDDTQWVCISVSDEGIGIDKSELGHIWERFYQVDGSATRRFGGTGLGLALVKEIVESHGGRVRAESRPGQGTTIYVLLPAAERTAVGVA